MPYASQTFLDDQVHLTDMAGKKFVANLIAVAEDNFDVQYQDIEHDKANRINNKIISVANSSSGQVGLQEL